MFFNTFLMISYPLLFLFVSIVYLVGRRCDILMLLTLLWLFYYLMFVPFFFSLSLDAMVVCTWPFKHQPGCRSHEAAIGNETGDGFEVIGTGG